MEAQQTPHLLPGLFQSYVHQTETALQVPHLRERHPWLLGFHEISRHTKNPGVKYLLSVMSS